MKERASSCETVKPESRVAPTEMQDSPSTNQILKEETAAQRYALLEFFVLTFAITWGLALLFLRFRYHYFIRFGSLMFDQPFYQVCWRLCVYAPAISALFVVARRHGFRGLWAYIRRVLRWRINIKWYLIVLIGFPAFYAIDRAIYITLGGTAPAYPFDPWHLVLLPALLSVVVNPAGVEEFGWRGFALPLLQRRFSALNASLILGTIWGCWHLPAFFFLGPPYTLDVFPVYLIQVICLSIMMTALYNATGGNVILAYLFHWQIHDPLHIDAFPHDLYVFTPMLVITALAITLIFGPKTLAREKSTEILASPVT